jgi:hypothetical protein
VKKEFSKGIIFSSQSVYKSIEAGYLLPPKDFIKFAIKETGKIMSFSRTKFTLREIIRIFDVVY